MALTPVKPEGARFCSMLIHGQGGAGKTRFLGTAQEDERTYPMAFLNFDAGQETLVGLDIDVFNVRSWEDYNEVYPMLADPGCKYRSVGIDSVSETQVGGLLRLLETPNVNRPNDDTVERGDWGVILVQMRRFVRHFKFLPMHVFMTALSKDDTIPRIGSVKRPLLQGQFADDILGIPNIVSYMAQEEIAADEEHPDGVRRLLLLHSWPKFMVKCRTPWNVRVPSEIEDPTVTKLLDVLGY